MSIKVITSINDFESNALILSVRPGIETAIDLTAEQKGAISDFIASGDFSAEPAEVVLVNNLAGFKGQRVILFGLGEKTSRCGLVNGMKKAVDLLSATGATKLAIAIDPTILDPKYTAKAIVESYNHSRYQFKRFKTLDRDADKHSSNCSCCTGVKEVALVVNKKYLKATKLGLSYAQAVSKGVKLTRDLANLPPNICTPGYLCESAVKLANEYSSIEVSYVNKEQMIEENMNLYLAVGSGSKHRPILTILNYQGADPDQAPIALVGKGMTFDTGGYSLKPAAGMPEMKYDMSGAATIIGLFKVIAELKLKINIVGFVAGCENAIDAFAYKPGDILTSKNGITVEVSNTDAEGRLVLADTLEYCKKYNPSEIIDIATLTGAVIVALGSPYTGIFSNTPGFAQELVESGQTTGDYGWHLPVTAPYKRFVKGIHADITNSSGNVHGGASQAAAFLSYFVKDYKWAHLDIAATAWVSGKELNATGRPVALLTEYLVNKAK